MQTKAWRDAAHALGALFTQKLRAEVGAVAMEQIVKRNITNPSGFCASHDFCDANVVMAEAFTDLFHCEFDLQADDHVAICNVAWDLAKAGGFTA